MVFLKDSQETKTLTIIFYKLIEKMDQQFSVIGGFETSQGLNPVPQVITSPISSNVNLSFPTQQTQLVVETSTPMMPPTVQQMVQTHAMPPTVQQTVQTHTIPPTVQQMVQTHAMPPTVQQTVQTRAMPPTVQQNIQTRAMPPTVQQMVGQINQRAVQFHLEPQTGGQIVGQVPQLPPQFHPIPPTVQQMTQQASQFRLGPQTVRVIPTIQPVRLIGGMGEIEDLEGNSRIELDDLVYFYPDINDPDFQGKIGRKLEFAELAGIGQESVPKRNEFFKHQTFVHRFLREYDDVLLMHPPGSGKTCSAGGSSEEFKRTFIAGMVDYTMQYLKGLKNQIRHVYILVPGVVIKSEFEKQIICNCSREGDYDLSFLEEIGPSAITRRVNKMLGRFYTIETYSKFVKNILDKHMTNRDIIREFSGSMFIIDEAHNLVPTKRGDFGVSEGSISRALKGETTDSSAGRGENSRKKKKKEKGLQKKLIYETIKRVFRSVKRSKRILMTATPMINSTHEILDLINLIIPNEEDEMKPGPNYQDASIEELKRFFGGRVSFVPELDTKVDAVYQGTLIPQNPKLMLEQGRIIPYQEVIGNRRYVFKTIVEISRMETSWSYINQQLELERRATRNPTLSIMEWVGIGGQGKGNPGFNIRQWVDSSGKTIQLWQDDGYQRVSQSRVKFMSDKRQAANFTFPDGSFGKVGFKKYIETNGDLYIPNAMLKASLSQFLLKYHSSKYARGIALIKSIGMGKVTPLDEIVFPEIKWEDRPKGKVFCFSEQLKGSGIIVYGLALEVNGYARFNQASSVFGGIGRAAQSFCVQRESDGTNEVDRIINIPRAPRYAMLTGLTSKIKREVLLELFNSRENRYGDYIQILLTTPVAQFGLNINDVIQIQLMEGGWHEAGHFQALSRSLRAASHISLLKDAKHKAIQAGDTLSEVRINVDIYQHASVSTSGNSVDLELYVNSERKAISIEKLFNKMKSLSIDCHVHSFRQERIGATGKLRHEPTTYRCLPTPNLPIDSSSYNVLYSDSNVIRAIDFIHEMFKIKSRYNFKELNGIYQRRRESIPEMPPIPSYNLYFYDPRFILLAAEKMIRLRHEIVDKLGFIRYLREDGKSLFLVEKYPHQGDEITLSSIYYVQRLIGKEDLTLEMFLNDIQRSQQEGVIEQLKLLPEGTPNILDIIAGLNNSSQIELLEWAFTEVVNKEHKPNPTATLVLQKFNYYIFGMGDPVGLVRIVQEKYAPPDPGIRPGRGRPRNIGNRPPINFTNDDEPGGLINPLYYPVLDINGNPIADVDGNPIVDIQGREVTDVFGNIYNHGVLFHNLTGVGQEETGYSGSSKTMTGNRKIRLLKLPKGGKRRIDPSEWRDLEEAEEPVYRHLARYLIETVKLKELDKHKVYGRLKGGKFKIYNKLNLEEGIVDRRRKPRGKVCTSYLIPELISFLYYYQIFPSDRTILDVDKERKIQILMSLNFRSSKIFMDYNKLNSMSESMLSFYYKWYVHIQNVTRKKQFLCQILQTYFESKGLSLNL